MTMRDRLNSAPIRRIAHQAELLDTSHGEPAGVDYPLLPMNAWQRFIAVRRNISN